MCVLFPADALNGIKFRGFLNKGGGLPQIALFFFFFFFFFFHSFPSQIETKTYFVSPTLGISHARHLPKRRLSPA